MRIWLGIAFLLLGMVSVGWERPSPEPMAERSSVATFGPNGEVSPTIQIREGRITVRHSATGSGVVRGTALRGARTYTFTQPGTYQVEPGTYRHIVFGQVPSGGSISSTVRY